MNPFDDKRAESYKNNILDNKSDTLENGNNSNYYPNQNPPSEKGKPEGIVNNGKTEQKENTKNNNVNNNNADSMNKNNSNNYNVINSNSMLNNDNVNAMNNNQNMNNGLLNNGNPSNIYGLDSENGYVSKFRFTPTINVDVDKNGDDETEKITKIKVRGWKLNLNIVKALAISINACSTITDLTLWNCGLTTEFIQEFINIITPESQIKSLTIDQNPLLNSDELYAQFITRESPLKFLSLRSNNITNKGAIAISESLKNNKNLSLLNLWNNKIGKEGAEAIAEALKINQNLVGLSLSKNIIKDEGAKAIAKAFSNILLPREEQLARKRTQIEMEKQKREPDEETGTKKGGKGKPQINHQNKTPSSNKDIRQKDTAQGDAKKKVTKVTKKDDKTKKTPDDKGSSNVKDKKAGQDDKSKKADGKKGDGKVKPTKKGKSDDLKDSSEDGDSSGLNMDHMFEINGQGYILGNRTLNILNLSKNELTEEVLTYFYNSLTEQDTTLINVPDELPGLIKLDLSDNNFSLKHPKLEQINQLLNIRNPFIPNEPDASLISNPELREDMTKTTSDFNNLNDN